MNFRELSRRFFIQWRLFKEESSKPLTIKDVGDIIRNVIEEEYGQFYFPDALYDSGRKRYRKSENRKTVKQLIEIAQIESKVLYKYRFYLEKPKSHDSVYSRRTIIKAKNQEMKLFEAYGNPPRRGRLERATGRNGRLHIQGIVALPEGEYPPKNFDPLYFDEDIEKSARKWDSYLSKVNDCRLQRDTRTRKLKGSFDIALLALAEWFIWKSKNMKTGKNNPSANWTVNIISTRKALSR